MKTLNPLDIHLEKTTLIEASAGTGKTYTITTLFCRLVATGLPVESILVVTFTEAAAAELKLRIRHRLVHTLERLRDDEKSTDDELISFLRKDQHAAVVCQRLSLAVTCFDQASILTIHSFCLKVLKENAFETHFAFEMKLMPDRSLFLNQAAFDFFMARVNHLDPLFLKYLDTRKVTPDNFVKFFGSVVSRKGLILLPGKTQFNDVFDNYRDEIICIEDILLNRSGEIIDLFLNHTGIDKRSYTKKNVPVWLEKSLKKIQKEGINTLFSMNEKGDALFKFTRSRIEERTKSGSPPVHELFDSCQRVSDLFEAFEHNLISLKHDFLTYFSHSLEEIKSSQGICFFDDLINDLSDALKQKGRHVLKKAVRSTYRACLIDEFQDTDPAQYEIFSQLFSEPVPDSETESGPGTPFFMIGDPKQAIYAFRGGDIFAYLKAARDSFQQFTLKQNYRSAPLLVQGVNDIFSSGLNPFLFDEIGFTPVSTPPSTPNRFLEKKTPAAPLHFNFINRVDSIVGKDGYIAKKTMDSILPDIVAKDILKLLTSDCRLKNDKTDGQDKITPQDIAVLVRTNKQAQSVQTALSNLNISAYLSKSGSVFESNEAIELCDILCAVDHSENAGFIKAALCTGVYNFNADQIFQLNEDENLLILWQDRFREYKEIWESKGFVSMIMCVFHGCEAFLKPDSNIDERKLTNFYHLIELISQADISQHLSPHYLIKWYARQLSKDFRDEAADELRLESDKKAVAIVTIHKSKGLEYPVVYLPYLWEGQKRNIDEHVLFHDPNKNNALTLDLGSGRIDEARVQQLKEDRAEQRRLLYVALTRASAMCRIFWGGIKNIQSSALAELLHGGDCKEDGTMIEHLQALQSRSGQSILVQTFDWEHNDVLPAQLTSPDEQQLSAGKLTRNIQAQWQMASFSSITKTAHTATQPVKEMIENADEKETIPLADFPKGARAGDAFHSIFETIDFTAPVDDITSASRSIFKGYGFSEPDHLSAGTDSVIDILNTPLISPDTRFCLKDIHSDHRLCEMEFTFPVSAFHMDRVRQALEMSNPRFKTSGYSQRLSQLSINSFKGFFKGFIDLVVVHEGKWYILDYKSNYLGRTYDQYGSDSVFSAMAEHHYFLQYHIYLIALHRYLKLRLTDYDFSSNFGGVFYLFLRGMRPGDENGNGLFFDCPKQKALNCLLKKIS